MTDTPQEIAVSQAAREAAADFSDAEARLWSMGDESAHSGPMRRGERDDSLTVQAFAAFEHRIASTRTPPDGEVGELIERLRRMKSEADELSIFNILVNPDGPEAADTLTAYRDKVERLEAALKPFAKAFEQRRDQYARRYEDRQLGERNFDEMPDAWPMDGLTFTMRDFRRALAALTDPPNLPPGD